MKTIDDLKTGDEIIVDSGVVIFLYQAHGKAYFASKEHYRKGIISTNTKCCFIEGASIPQEPEYIPFTEDDWELFRGKWIKSKTTPFRSEITGIDYDVVQASHLSRTYKEAFDYWTFEDGTPFGKEVK